MRFGVIFSTIASAVALVLSVLSFYYSWLNEEPRLIAKTDKLLFGFSATTSYETNDPVTTRNLDMHAKFILSNPGNRPTTLLRVFWAIPLSQDASCDDLPADAKYPEAAGSFKAEGFDVFPLALESKVVRDGDAGAVVGKVSDLPHPNKRLAGFKAMSSCVIFVAADHLGETHTTVFSWIKRLPPFDHKFRYVVSHEPMDLI
jgi:hypothetical protein